MFWTSALTVLSDGNRRRGDFFQFAKHVKVQVSLVGLYGGLVGVQKWLREQDVSFYRQGLKDLIISYGTCLNEFSN
jgi:hypothetical protein